MSGHHRNLGRTRRRRIRRTYRAVFERDQWQCRMPECLCPDGRDIDPRLRGSADPWAPTIDHITEAGSGGNWGPTNLRAAHRVCNEAAAVPDREKGRRS